MIRRTHIGILLSAAGLLFIGAMTLIPEPGQVPVVLSTSVLCLVCGDLGTVDVVLNLLLFVPLGAGLALLGWSTRRAMLAVAATTLLIELLQLKVIVGRDASLSDLLTNTAGGVLGLLLVRRGHGLLFPPPAAARRLALGGAVAWVLLQAFGAWAVRPSLPRSAWWGQWAPDLEHLEQFLGSVGAASLGPLAIPNGEMRFSDSARTLLQRGTTLRVEAATGALPPGLAPIVSVYDDRQRMIFLLGQDRKAAVFQLRTRLQALLLRSPAISLPGAMPERAGVPAGFQAGYARGRLRLQLDLGDTTAVPGGTPLTRELALSPSWAWSFVLPYDYYFGWKAPWLTALWIAGLLFPVGYWAGRARKAAALPFPPVALLAGTAATGLAGAALAFGIPVPAAGEWVAAALGSAAGVMVGKRA